MPTYSERLIANNQKIDDITTLANTLPDADEINEKIDAQDIIIENLKSALDEKAGKGGAKLNVFTQLTEPTTKKGIWLQTDKQMEHFVSDENVFIGGTWDSASNYKTIPYPCCYGKAVTIGTNIYLFSYYSNNNYVYKYDTLTDTYTQLSTDLTNLSSITAVAVGTDIYLFNRIDNVNYAYKFDTLTNTYITLSTPTYDISEAFAFFINNSIYIAKPNNYMYKYDITNDTYTQLATAPSTMYLGSASAIGNDIYFIASSASSTNTYRYYVYKYDILTNTYTKMADKPIQACGLTLAIGTNIYMFGAYESSQSRAYFYKYDSLSNVWTQLSNMPRIFTHGLGSVVGTKAYIFGGYVYPSSWQSNVSYDLSVYAAESKSYETDNTVVVAQGKTYDVGYNTELLTTELAEEDYQPLYGFADAWYYTIEGGLDTTIPTYYGNGTQWINIKNPPQEEQEGSED